MTADADTGSGLGIGAELSVMLGRLADGIDKQNRFAERKTLLYETLHQVPLGPANIAISGGAGTLQINDLFKAKTGYCWSVRRLTTSLYTAGTVTGFQNGLIVGGALVGGAEPVAPFPQAGVLTFGRGELLLQGDDWLTFTATGITLTAGAPGVQVNGMADMFETWLLPDYIL